MLLSSSGARERVGRKVKSVSWICLGFPLHGSMGVWELGLSRPGRELKGRTDSYINRRGELCHLRSCP